MDDPVTVGRLDPRPDAPARQVFVDMQLTRNRCDVVDEQGRVVTSDSRKVGTSTVGVGWQDGGWKLLDMETRS